MLSTLPLLMLAALAAPQDPERGWSGSADGSLIWLSGNNDSITSAVDITTTYQDIGYRWIFEGNYYGVRQEPSGALTGGMTTSRLYRLAADHHRFLDETDNLYLYGNASGRSDVPNGLDIRQTVGVGIGHTWRWDDDQSSVSAEAGPSWLKENMVGLPSGDGAINGRAAARLDSKLDEDWSLLGRAEFFQSFDETDDRSLTGELGVRWNFDDTWYLQATAGVSWDNTPAPGFDKTDYRYVLGVGTTF